MKNTRSGTGAATAGRVLAGTLVAAALALAGCGAERPGNGASSVHGLVVHEWGTFTSLQGSDGRVMDGLHHTEELLPAFVHGRLASSGGLHKSMEALPEAVTQKLETPVIYFYGDVPRATVDVEFPGGVISEWYPGATAMAPAVGSLTRIAEGRMTWDVGLRELDAVKHRCANEGLEVIGLRFRSDRLVPAERFEFLRRELGDAFVAVELEDADANPDAVMTPHSVLTEHLIDEPGTATRDALELVLNFIPTLLPTPALPCTQAPPPAPASPNRYTKPTPEGQRRDGRGPAGSTAVVASTDLMWFPGHHLGVSGWSWVAPPTSTTARWSTGADRPRS